MGRVWHRVRSGQLRQYHQHRCEHEGDGSCRNQSSGGEHRLHRVWVQPRSETQVGCGECHNTAFGMGESAPLHPTATTPAVLLQLALHPWVDPQLCPLPKAIHFSGEVRRQQG